VAKLCPVMANSWHFPRLRRLSGVETRSLSQKLCRLSQSKLGVETSNSTPAGLKVGKDYTNKALQLRNLWSRNASCAGLDQNLEYAYSLELNPFFTNPQPDGERYFYHSDHLGSSAYITTENGYATQFLAYMPYGETLSEQQNSTSYYSPFKFSAKEKDPETGYSYFGARYYSPELSVWLSIDPLADKAPGWTPYRYGFNNPIRFIDPTGMLETDGDPTKKGDEKPKATPPQAPSKPAPKAPEQIMPAVPNRLPNQPVKRDNSTESCPNCVIADYLRNTPSFGIQGNPFYLAEAIFVDGGWNLSGAEGDYGYFFILIGVDKGKFVSFNEIAGGGALDGGVGLEMGRVDYLGNPQLFNSKVLFGAREKIFGSLNQGLFSVGGAYSLSEYQNKRVLATSIQLGFGLSPSLLLLGGYNLGVIKP
jgi:RHS repeat-associated protein